MAVPVALSKVPDTQMGLSISLRGAVALLGNFPALTGADLQVSPGEVVAVRGPNGAGKTSLLNVCAGLIPVVAGEVEVLGLNLRADRRRVRRKIGMLGHSCQLYEDLTAQENVTFQTKAAGVSTCKVESALARLGMDGKISKQRVSTLSQGQRRRTSIAALIARSPQLWLLDEPHAGLDLQARHILDRAIVEAASKGSTVVIVSHESDVIEALATRVVTMAGGRVIADVREPMNVA